MTTPSPAPSRGLNILKIVLYVLAGLILALGLIAGILLIASASATAENILMPLLIMGIAPVVNLIRPVLMSFFVNLGIAIAVIALVISALLYGLGRLIGHALNLEARIAKLEARLAE